MELRQIRLPSEEEPVKANLAVLKILQALNDIYRRYGG
jgi:hypothetical protein